MLCLVPVYRTVSLRPRARQLEPPRSTFRIKQGCEQAGTVKPLRAIPQYVAEAIEHGGGATVANHGEVANGSDAVAGVGVSRPSISSCCFRVLHGDATGPDCLASLSNDRHPAAIQSALPSW